MPRSIPLLALALVLLAVPASASALATPRWKTSTITYRDNSQGSLDQGAVKTAIKWWNAAPGPLVFKRAASGQKAMVTFRSVSTKGVDWDGLATYNTDSSGTYLTTAVLSLNDYFLKREDKEYVSEVTAHELGHAFGLPHISDKCSLMYPSGSVATRCPDDAFKTNPGSGRFDRGPQRSDVRSLLARYPGSIGNWPGTICTGTPPPRARSTALVPFHG